MHTSVTLSAPFFVGLLMAIHGGIFRFSCRRGFTLFFWDAKGFDFHVFDYWIDGSCYAKDLTAFQFKGCILYHGHVLVADGVRIFQT